MAKVCDVCGKGVSRGNAISHAHNVSHREWRPNLKRVRARMGNGQVRQIKVCTRCLRSDRVKKAVRGTAPVAAA
jgi:large subunit ribosomal protein L28